MVWWAISSDEELQYEAIAEMKFGTQGQLCAVAFTTEATFPLCTFYKKWIKRSVSSIIRFIREFIGGALGRDYGHY